MRKVARQQGRRAKRRGRVVEDRGYLGIARMIRDRRFAAGLNQTELAVRMGTTPSVISRLESAEYQGQSLLMLQRIATALGLRLEVRLLAKGARRGQGAAAGARSGAAGRRKKRARRGK